MQFKLKTYIELKRLLGYLYVANSNKPKTPSFKPSVIHTSIQFRQLPTINLDKVGLNKVTPLLN